MALRAALQKLSASASAMAEASQQIAALASKLEVPSQQPPVQVDNAPRLTTPPPAYPYDRNRVTRGDAVEQPEASRSSVAAGRTTAYPLPPAPSVAASPAMSTEAKIMRGVSIGGAAITIAGIILLVSVAIQRGWLGPLGRVTGSYLIAVVLLTAAVWVRNRGTRVEAVVALVVTSQVAALATTGALIYFLEWWPPGIGSLVMLLINVGFVLLGRIWSTPANPGYGSAVLLATTIVTGLTSWFDFGNAATPWPEFGLIATLLITIRVATARVRIAVAVLATVLQLLLSTVGGAMAGTAIITGSLTAVLLVSLTLWDPPATPGGDARGSGRGAGPDTTAFRVAVIAPIVILGFTSLSVGVANSPWWLLLPTAVIAGLGIQASLFSSPDPTPMVHSATVSPDFARTARIARPVAVTGLALVAAAFVFIRYTPLLFEHRTQFGGALAVVAFFLTASAVTFWLNTLPRDRDLGMLPWISWIIAAVAISGVLFRNVVALSPVWLTDGIALVQAALILLFIAVVVLAREVFYNRVLWLQLGVGAAVLYLSATAIVTIVTYLGNLLGGSFGMKLGFLIGHAGVSILWMVIAAALMLSRRLLDQPGALWTGVGLAVAGTVKLVFFDLVALDGVPRAIAFLASGMALLAIAAMRGRRNAEPRDTDGDPAHPPLS